MPVVDSWPLFCLNADFFAMSLDCDGGTRIVTAVQIYWGYILRNMGCLSTAVLVTCWPRKLHSLNTLQIFFVTGNRVICKWEGIGHESNRTVSVNVSSDTVDGHGVHPQHQDKALHDDMIEASRYIIISCNGSQNMWTLAVFMELLGTTKHDKSEQGNKWKKPDRQIVVM